MPIYNGASSISQALDSLLAQTFTDFEMVISDNASTDTTEQICRKYAIRDRRIKYIRQSENKGAIFNFNFVLQEARGEYFMWAAADDFWQPSFIEKNHQVLSQDRNVVSSISKVRMATIIHKPSKMVGTYPISGNYLGRLRQYLSGPWANSRFYGLFRRDSLLRAVFGEFLYPWDWAVVINLLKDGNFYEVDEVLMERGCDGDSSSKLLIEQLRSYNLKWPNSVFPLFDFTRWLWLKISRTDFIKCLDLIVRLNLFFTLILAAEFASIRRKKPRVKQPECRD